jgi:hypothetical protein
MTRPVHRIAQAAVVATALLTGACVTDANGFDESPASFAASDIGRWVPVEPGRTRIAVESSDALSARQLRTSQGELVQTVTLANNTAVPGDNQLVAAFDYGPPSIFAADVHAPKIGHYAMAPAALNGLLAEMLPRAVIAGEPQIRRNRYGLYGYVAAEYPGQAKCVLAWQVLDGADAPGGNPPRRTGIQMRVCDARAQAADLVAPFDKLHLDM